jgi:hypothetical protein
MSSKLSQRGRVAALSRSRPPDDPELLEAKGNLKAQSLEEHVRRVVAEAPPLTDEQRDRIASLLRTGGGAS